MNEKIIEMLKSTDKEMVELGIHALLQEPLRAAEVNVYLQLCISSKFNYYWRDEVKEGESLIVLTEYKAGDGIWMKDPNSLLKLTPIKVKDYDTED